MQIERRSVLATLRVVFLLTISLASGWLGYELLVRDEIRMVERHEAKERALLKEVIAKIHKASSISAERKFNTALEQALDGHRRLLGGLNDTQMTDALARLPGVDAVEVHGHSLDHDFYTERHATLSKAGRFEAIVAWLHTLSQSDVLLAPQRLEIARSKEGLTARLTVALFSRAEDHS